MHLFMRLYLHYRHSKSRSRFNLRITITLRRLCYKVYITNFLGSEMTSHPKKSVIILFLARGKAKNGSAKEGFQSSADFHTRVLIGCKGWLICITLKTIKLPFWYAPEWWKPRCKQLSPKKMNSRLFEIVIFILIKQ